MKKLILGLTLFSSMSSFSGDAYVFETSIETRKTVDMEFYGDKEPMRSENPEIQIITSQTKPLDGGGYIMGESIYWVSYKSQLKEVEVEHWAKIDNLTQVLKTKGYANIKVTTNSDSGTNCAKTSSSSRFNTKFAKADIENHYDFSITAECKSHITYTK